MKTNTFHAFTLCLATSAAISNAALVQIEFDLLHSVGGSISKVDGDFNIFEPSLGDYLVGGADTTFTGQRDIQGSYEFDLRDPSIMVLGADQIVSVFLTIERSGFLTTLTSSPDLNAEVAGYIGDGVFDTGDFRVGRQLGTFTIYNSQRTPWPHPDSKIDVTSFFMSLLDGGFDYIGFNMRPISIPAGASVNNGFLAPRLEITALIPEPSTAGLAALGVLALALRRRRG